MSYAVSILPELPSLEQGDRLSRAEFERRYEAMPDVRKAELVEGVVHMPSPVRDERHSQPHVAIVTWLGTYAAATPGALAGNDATVRLDLDNEFQPDALLRLAPEHGGRTRTESDYIAGAPELVVEVAASSASRDLHDKLRVYRRNGVQEYVVWRVLDGALDWFELRDGTFVRVEPDADGRIESRVFPGLRLDVRALLDADIQRVLDVVRAGIAGDAHRGWVERFGETPGP